MIAGETTRELFARLRNSADTNHPPPEPRRRRPADWEARLDAAIFAAIGRRFQWGSFDCCLWACDIVALMRGVDLAAPFRGRYDDERSAYRALRAFAGGGLEATAERIAEAGAFDAIAPEFAQRGDVALVSTPAGDALAIVIGAVALAPGPVGLRHVPIAAARRAWAV